MTDIPILTFNPEATPDEIGVNLDRLIESRMLIQANSGGGKSHLIRSLLEQTHGRVQQLVFDPEGEFATLREKFPFVLAGPEGDLETHVETAQALCGKFLELGFSCVIDLSDLTMDDKREYIHRFTNELMRLRPKPGSWPPVLIVIDELQIFAEEGSKDSCTKAVINLTNRGRKRGYCVVGATLRLSLISKSVASELTTLIIGRTRLDIDIKRAVILLAGSRSVGSHLPTLLPGEFYVYGPSLPDPDSVTLVKSAPVLTSHHRIGSSGGHTPAAPEQLHAVLVALSSIPKEVQEEPQTVEGLRAEIKRLRAEPATATASPIEKIVKVPVEVEVEKIVIQEKEVPVLDAEQEERLRGWLAQLTAVIGEGRELADDVLAALATVKKSASQTLSEATEPTPLILPPAPPPAPPATSPRSKPTHQKRTSASTQSGVSNPLQRVVDGLAEFDRAGVTSVSRQMLAVWLEVSPATGSYRTTLSQGKQRALIGFPREGMLKLTDKGLDVSRPASAVSKTTLGQKLLKRLDPSHSLIFKALLDAYPRGLSLDELAERVSANPNSASHKREVAAVVGLGFAQMNKNEVKAVFPEGLK